MNHLQLSPQIKKSPQTAIARPNDDKKVNKDSTSKKNSIGLCNVLKIIIISYSYMATEEGFRFSSVGFCGAFSTGRAMFSAETLAGAGMMCRTGRAV